MSKSHFLKKLLKNTKSFGMEPTKRVRVKKVTELSFQCQGTMHLTVKKIMDRFGGEENHLCYTFKGENVDLHGMLHHGSVSKLGETNFLFFNDAEMVESVEMAGTVSDAHSVTAIVGEEAGTLTEQENMFGGKHVM